MDAAIALARLRRATFPAFFFPELLSGSLAPLLAVAYAADVFGYSSGGALAVFGAIWFGCEALLARIAGWHATFWSPLAWVMRDVLLPVLWAQAWLGSTFNWRGNDMDLANAATTN